MRHIALLALLWSALWLAPAAAQSLGDALGWKHGHFPGIATGERGGETVILNWPKALGPAPNAAKQQQIIAEYAASLAAQAKEPDDLSVIIEVLKDAGVVTDQLIETKRQQLRTR